MTKLELIQALDPFPDTAEVWAMTGHCTSSEVVEVGRLGCSDIMLETTLAEGVAVSEEVEE